MEREIGKSNNPPPQRIPKHVELRFWSHVAVGPPHECWLWQSALRGNNDYGAFTIGKRTFYAHRLSWELTNGPIPHGKIILHSCDRPRCVNPRHLSLGNAADNARDRETKGRGNIAAAQAAAAAKYAETCKNGHPWTPESTVIKKRGRQCYICFLKEKRDRYHRVQAEKRAAQGG